MRASMSVRAPRQADYKAAPPGGALNLNVQHIRADIEEAAEEARGWALLALPVGSGRRGFAADDVHARKLQRGAELDADYVARARDELRSNLARLLEQLAAELVDAKSWDSALEQVLDTAVEGGMEPIQVWEMCKSTIEQWSGNDERRARVASVVDGWYTTDVLRSNLTRLLEQPDAQLVDVESWDGEFEKVLSDSRDSGLRPHQVWEVCKSIIEQWSGNDQRRNRAAEVSVDWYFPYAE